VVAILANVLVGLVALLHIYFLIFEMFLWDKPFGRHIFGHSLDYARTTKALAMNQGLYNGFGAYMGLGSGVRRKPH
jgi:putative membrane protein